MMEVTDTSTPQSLYLLDAALGTHWIRGWMDPRASLYAVAKKQKYLVPPGYQILPDDSGRPNLYPFLYPLIYLIIP
jgi:hypothetical protein